MRNVCVCVYVCKKNAMIKVTLPNEQMAYKMRKIYFYSYPHLSAVVRCIWWAAWCSLFTLNLFHLSHFYLVSNFPENDVKMIDVNFSTAAVAVDDDDFFSYVRVDAYEPVPRFDMCLCVYFWIWTVNTYTRTYKPCQVAKKKKFKRKKSRRIKPSLVSFSVYSISSQHCVWYCAARTARTTLDTFSKHAYKVSNARVVCVRVRELVSENEVIPAHLVPPPFN